MMAAAVPGLGSSVSYSVRKPRLKCETTRYICFKHWFGHTPCKTGGFYLPCFGNVSFTDVCACSWRRSRSRYWWRTEKSESYETPSDWPIRRRSSRGRLIWIWSETEPVPRVRRRKSFPRRSVLCAGQDEHQIIIRIEPNMFSVLWIYSATNTAISTQHLQHLLAAHVQGRKAVISIVLNQFFKVGLKKREN